MEVHFAPELEERLRAIAAQTGRAPAALVQDVVAGYVEEIAQVRATLDRRYDDIQNGTVKRIPGDEVEAHFRKRSAAARKPQPGS